MDLKDYIKDVKSQLICNASDEYKKEFITFDYTEKEIDENMNYFTDCFFAGFSAYKALTLFYSYLYNYH